MSFFGDDDFSFLDTYRDRSNDEDESDSEHSHMNSSSSSSDGEDNEQDRTYTGVDSFELPQSPAAADTQVEGQEDSNDEPSPWRNSKAKMRIIAELKEDNATIHSMKVEEVHERFASRYLLRLFKNNYKRLLDHMEAKTGPFGEGEQQVSEEEPAMQKWYSQGNISTGYSLLYSILMEPEDTGIENMLVHEIWQSHAAFSCYDFESFQGYYKNMQALTKKHRKIVTQDEADFQHDMKLIPEKTGLIWHKHPAKELLKEDVKRGVALSMKPQELRETSPEYKSFSKTKFCKEVHHEKQRQRAKPFWQWFCNKEAREMHESHVNELRRTWISDVEINQLSEVMERIWTPTLEERT